MTQSWFAVAGKIPELSLAELKCQLPHFSRSSNSIYSVAQEWIEIKGEIPSGEQLNRLGGIVRAGRVLGHYSQNQVLEEIDKMVMTGNAQRFDIGISGYDQAQQKDIIHLGLLLKRRLKRSGRAVRIVLPQLGATLSPVVVQKQLLTKNGREFVVFVNGKDWLLNETAWVHQFDQWGEREFGKPSADKVRGLLPHKLARIMLNLTGLYLDSSTTVFDPFCGSGVVLLEARQLGCQIYGSDIDGEAIVATKRNLGLPIDDRSVWQADARNVQVPPGESKKAAIVCEPYLGPIWHGSPDRARLEAVIEDLVALYLASLKHWRSQIATGTPVVMVFPVIDGIPTFERIVDKLDALPYSCSIKPIRYQRDDQVVVRDIVCLVA